MPTMQAALGRMADLTNGQRWIDMYSALETAMYEENGIRPNLDFPTGPAYYLMGFDIPMLPPLRQVAHHWLDGSHRETAGVEFPTPSAEFRRRRRTSSGTGSAPLMTINSSAHVESSRHVTRWRHHGASC